MNATRKVKLKEINPNLTCILCKGYFIDATTIIECLHSFCKSCIVKHLEKSEYCPACDVQLHTTKPLSSIRSDQMLQEIVYKLVPGLFQNETARRRQFYKENPESTPCSQEDSGHVYNYSYITSDDIIHLSLEYYTDDIEFRESTKRYIKCPAAVSIAILKKLIYGKFDLGNEAQIDIMYGDRILPDDFLLMDIAYKYSWTHNGNKPLQLCYQVKGIPKSSYLHLVKPKNSSVTAFEPKATALTVKRRQSRTSTNAAATAITVNEKSTLDSTPNKKATQRGRRKRKVSNNEEIPGKIAKKTKKEPKVKPESSPLHVPEKLVPKVELGSKSTATSTTPLPECKEVQLRISENGVISARSVSSGEEKIIINSVANNSTNVSTPTKTTVANTTTPSSMMTQLNNSNINKNHTPNISFHPILTINSAHPSPLDISLNRENCIASAKPHDKQNNTNSMGVTITNAVRDVNNSSPSSKFNLPPGTKLTPIRKKKEKPNQLEKSIVERTTPASVTPGVGVTTLEKAKVSKKANQDKCANVKKAMSDLEKKLQTHTKKYTKKGSTNLFPKDVPLGQSPMPIPTQTSQHHLQINGTLKHSMPSPLLHSLPPGTGLSLVPTTSASFTDSLNSPVKRFPQHNTLTTASVVNGDLKFTTSPKHLLPSPSPQKDPLVMGSPSPKKPPKFFKSRHSTSAAGSPVNGESPTNKSSTSKLLDSNKSKINSLHNVNGVSPKRTVDTITESINNAILNVGLPNTTNSTPTTSTAGYGSVGANSQFKFPPNLTSALNAINMSNLNMNMNIAAANGFPINLVPFVTSNYCSMPFQNQRNPYNMNMSFPFSYPGVSMSSAPTATASSNSSPVNITKPSNPYPAPTNTLNLSTSTSSLSLPSSLSSPDSTSGNNHNNMNTLDLSMTKNKSYEGINGKEPHKFRPITSIQPASQSLNSQTPAVDRNHNNSEFLNIPRVGKSKPSPKALHPKPNPSASAPRKSPIKNLEALLTLSGNGGGVGSSNVSGGGATGKLPEKSPTEKPLTSKSPGKKELADIIVNLTDQQKKLEKQANSNGTAANSSSINNNSPKHVNNNNVAIPTTINSSNNNSTATTTAPTATKNHVVYLGLNLNGNTSSASGSNEKSSNNGHNSIKSIANSLANTLVANHSKVSPSPCKTVGNENHHHNNNNNKVIEPEKSVSSDSSSCLKANDSNNSNVLANGPNGNVNSNGPLEGLNNLIANSTGGGANSGSSNSNNSTTAPTPLPSSSSTSA